MRDGVEARGGSDGARPDLSIVVVTWNVRELTVACLASIEAHQGGLDVEVIVVDNDSADGTVEAVREAYPGVVVEALDDNLGFPAANNVGIARSRGRHVLLLNPDTEVGAGALERCVAALDADPGLGAVGCRLIHRDGRIQYECARRAYRLRHLVWEAFYLHMLFPHSGLFAHHHMGEWDHTDDREVEAISGAFFMARREVLEEVGGLPTDLFMYHEDLALALRVREAGWRIAYLGSVATVHHAGASSARSPSPLELLEGEVRVRLIGERSGVVWGWLARLFFAFRQAVRSAIAVVVHLPGLGGVRRRWPAVADVGKHTRLLAWTVAPGWALRDVPKAPAAADTARGWSGSGGGAS